MGGGGLCFLCLGVNNNIKFTRHPSLCTLQRGCTNTSAGPDGEQAPCADILQSQTSPMELRDKIHRRTERGTKNRRGSRKGNPPGCVSSDDVGF